MCKDSVTTDAPAGSQTAEAATLGFNNSIYAMLAGLAGVAGFTGVTLYKAAAKNPEP